MPGSAAAPSSAASDSAVIAGSSVRAPSEVADVRTLRPATTSKVPRARSGGRQDDQRDRPVAVPAALVAGASETRGRAGGGEARPARPAPGRGRRPRRGPCRSGAREAVPAPVDSSKKRQASGSATGSVRPTIERPHGLVAEDDGDPRVEDEAVGRDGRDQPDRAARVGSDRSRSTRASASSAVHRQASAGRAARRPGRDRADC